MPFLSHFSSPQPLGGLLGNQVYTDVLSPPLFPLFSRIVRLAAEHDECEYGVNLVSLRINLEKGMYGLTSSRGGARRPLPSNPPPPPQCSGWGGDVFRGPGGLI